MKNLIEIITAILNERNKKWAEWDKSKQRIWDSLKDQMEKKITEENNLQTLNEAIIMDKEDLLPFEQKKMLFEKILSIEESKEMLQTFGWWLQANGGPDYDDDAYALLSKANNII